MTELIRFDPFNNRLCRNVRNALTQEFKVALRQKDMQPVHRIAGIFVEESQPECVLSYIEKRLVSYRQVLTVVAERRLQKPLDIAVVIWNHRLFFETHEYLETFWLDADGDEKKIFQAMIRSAGTYVHLEQGNLAGARKIADKAIPAVKAYQDRLSRYLDPQLLLKKLMDLDPLPPTFSGMEF